MKILLLNDDFLPEARGGSAVIVYRLAKKFKELNHEVLVVTTVRDKTKAGNFKLEDIEVFRIYSKYPYRFRAYVSLYNPKVISGLKKVIESFSPDVINFHNIHEYFSYASLSMAKKFSKPIFLTMHDVMAFSYGKLFPKVINYQKGKIPQVDYRVTFFDSLKRAKLRFNPFRNLIIRHYLKYPDKIFSVSGELKKVLELHGIKNIEPIYNGINLEEKKFSPATTQLLKEKFN